MRIDWKSERVGVARCPADFKVLGEGEAAGTFEAYVAIFGTPDRPDFFGDSDVIEPGALTQALQEGLPPVGQALQAVADAKACVSGGATSATTTAGQPGSATRSPLGDGDC